MRIFGPVKHVAVTAAVVALSAALGVLAMSVWKADSEADSVRASLDRAVPQQIHSGTELRLVLVGASTCGASTADSLKPVFARVRDAVARIAIAEDKQLRVVGVALDWSIPQGMEFLHSFGSLDEVDVGGNWLNTVAVAYLLRDLPGRAAIPQLLLIERDVTIDGGGASVSPDRLLARKVGVGEITEWADELQSHAGPGL